MEQITRIIRRVFFAIAFIFAGLAAWEKLANLFGLTLLRVYAPFRLLEFSAIALLFLIVLQLREIRISLDKKSSD